MLGHARDVPTNGARDLYVDSRNSIVEIQVRGEIWQSSTEYAGVCGLLDGRAGLLGSRGASHSTGSGGSNSEKGYKDVADEGHQEPIKR